MEIKIVIILLALAWVATGIAIINGKTAGIVEDLGRPRKMALSPGFHLIYPYPFSRVVARIDLRQREIRAKLSVKTVDNVFVEMPVVTQFHASDIPSESVKAFYELSDPEQQIKSYVLNVVRQAVSSMSLQDLFSNQNALRDKVVEALAQRFEDFGYSVDTVLVEDPTPPQDIQDNYNRVMAATRGLEAAKLEAQAERARLIGIAEAEAESKRLQGEGIANQRKEIAKGLKEAMETFSAAVPGAGHETLIAIMMMTNQLDTITSASNNKATTILLPYGSENAINDMGRVISTLQAIKGK